MLVGFACCRRPWCYADAVIGKLIALAVVVGVAARLFVHRDSELARRFRLFIDVSLIAIAVLYGGRLIQLYWG